MAQDIESGFVTILILCWMHLFLACNLDYIPFKFRSEHFEEKLLGGNLKYILKPALTIWVHFAVHV